MKFSPTPLPGAWLIEPERLGDERGWFARTFDAAEFRAREIELTVVQANTSFSPRRDTLRGMHYQADPHGEPKLISCVRGAIFDVGVDLRPESPSYCRWFGARLDAESGRALYLPRGVAHGLQTLTDDCEVRYLMGHEYVPDAGRGVRFDDPAFAIAWPEPSGERTISERDRSYAAYRPSGTPR
jgi:dTDP-4-dehydrorhamnose 3,5-epimerase